MTNQRIRYRKATVNDTGILVSTRHLLTDDGKSYQVYLSSNHTFDIINSYDKTTVETGKATSQHKVKIKAKEALIKLGVKFQEESRETDV